MLSAEIIRELREDRAESDKSVKVIVCTFGCLLFSVSVYHISLA